jgi:alpha-tubulin suppressor-like RCC1 family protein
LGNGTGDGTPSSDPIPGHKVAAFTASHLTGGSDFTCAQTSDLGNIACWGNNSGGVMNPDTVTNRYYTVPTPVALGLPAGLTVKEVATSGAAKHVCTIISDGSLMCWGDNHYLQTGTGQASNFVTVPSFVQANW